MPEEEDVVVVQGNSENTKVPSREMDEKTRETLSILANQEWNAKFTGFLIQFGILTVILLGCWIAILATGGIRNIVDEWSRYRCNPFIMPITELFGYDSSENFQFCVRSMMISQSGSFFQPIYGLLGQYSSSLGLIVNTMNGFRKTLGHFKLSTDTFVGGVMAKIQALLFQVRIMFLRMQTLMGRVYGTMYSIIWMGTSAITAGTNLADNDLVNFMFEFCFAPETLVRLADGTLRSLEEIQIGDILEGNVRVTSTFQFKGNKTPMVQIGQDILSAEHRVFADQWIPAHQHPAAVPTSSLPRLVCLNVEGHAFHTAAGLFVADYDESEDPQAIADTQRIAEYHLNGRAHTGSTPDYALGTDPTAEVWMADGSWKPLATIELGEHVYGGAEVLGLVKEVCTNVYEYGNVLISGAQLVYVNSKWVRAERFATPVTTSNAPSYLQHLITDRAGPLFVRKSDSPIVIRDYREAPVPDMEVPYLDALAVKE